jgi:hypothetical protein
VGLREKLLHLPDEEAPWDVVLARCGLSTVDCAAGLHQLGVEIAFFLQFHDDSNMELPASHARGRLAYRNFAMDPVNFTRAIDSNTGIIGQYDQKKVFGIPSGRSERPYYRNGLVTDVTIEARDDTTVTARLDFTKLPGSGRRREELTVQFPQRGRDFRCSCCSRSYRMPLLSSSTR